MLVIALNGYAQSGKDTFCSLLKKALPSVKIHRIAFADELKWEVGAANIPFCKNLLKLTPKRKEEIRPLLIWWGQERRRQDPDYWIKAVKNKLKTSVGPDDVVVITDNRFLNETLWLKTLPNVILVNIWRIDRRKYTPFNCPNETERANQGKVALHSDYIVKWPSAKHGIAQLMPHVQKFIRRYNLYKSITSQ